MTTQPTPKSKCCNAKIIERTEDYFWSPTDEDWEPGMDDEITFEECSKCGETIDI